MGKYESVVLTKRTQEKQDYPSMRCSVMSIHRLTCYQSLQYASVATCKQICNS